MWLKIAFPVAVVVHGSRSPIFHMKRMGNAPFDDVGKDDIVSVGDASVSGMDPDEYYRGPGTGVTYVTRAQADRWHY
jgi:hypothetical protein